MSIHFNLIPLDMSILFCTFVVEIRTTSSPPETRIIGKHMKETLALIQDSSLQKAMEGINEVLSDLKEALGEDRFKNSFYTELLRLSTPIDWEYFDRQNKKEDTL